MTKPVAALLQKEMTRKEFLTTAAFGIVSITGFSSVLHLLTGKSAESHLSGKASSLGYGSSVYGGK